MPRWEYLSHGGNIYATVRIFMPRWEYLYHNGSIYAVMGVFIRGWEYLCHSETIYTMVGVFRPCDQQSLQVRAFILNFILENQFINTSLTFTYFLLFFSGINCVAR